MKKIISVVVIAVLICSLALATGCGQKSAEKLEFGMGVSANYGDAKNAEGETNGSGEFITTVVAVLLDSQGKIVKIDLDTAQMKMAWTSEGKLVATTDFETKYEKGDDYNMAKYGKKNDGSAGKPLEWYAQADAFMTTVTDKTLDQVKALVGSDGYGTGDLVTAGCTINVGDFMKALEKAVNNAAASDATANDTINVALVSSNSHSNKDATAEADGLNQIDTSIVAAVVNSDGKVVVSKTDCTEGKVTFNSIGVATVDTTAVVKSKLELGDDYGMAKFGKKHDGSEGKPLEWYAQAAAFDAALVGKTASEFAALAADDGYATGDLATAGCTVSVGNLIAAAVKAATVA